MHGRKQRQTSAGLPPSPAPERRTAARAALPDPDRYSPLRTAGPAWCAVRDVRRESSLKQDGEPHDGDHSGLAELTGLNKREGWLKGMRLIARRVRPSGRHTENLTDLEKKTGWKYSIIATNITKFWGVPGSHQTAMA